ncbi:trimethylamine-N-oxide reductase TorA [Aliiruegeria lutimaris]|uniref:trimethylamine-N-oxide reductase n=1 Tax=Aliiruegeria lutimaris TaxID=571298 RepID=A0A1G9N8I0_9RHOB|nr:trimethylamine-N-oxide reductase TorA [Aliiruegeria lutimaris]SDL82768.1 trimethylamine-N-oxide reductase (cytochrome c) [Aliiruegeria lutimaris]
MSTHSFFASRRSVLKGLTALGAGTLIAPALLRPAHAAVGGMMADGDVINGSHYGFGYAKVEGGRIVGMTAHEKDHVPNKMFETLPDWVYSPTRIKYPMVRKGFLQNGHESDRTERGKGEFVRVSWEEALDLVAAELKRVKETHGNGSIYGGSYGWKTPGLFHNCFNNLYRTLNLHGGFVNDVQTYSTGAIRVIMPYVNGGPTTSSTWPAIIENTELLVFWGANPALNCRIGWKVPDHAGLKYLNDFKATGKQTIVVDPIRNDTAQLLESDWIAPRQGTDVAMMLGVAHTLLEEDLHDKAFLADYCVGFEEFSAYLTGESDGTAKTADWASEICGVDAEQIRELARLMASKRTMINMGWSIQRQHHGEQGPWMAFTLACMLGYTALPGGGADFQIHYANYGTPKGTAPIFPGFPAGETPEGLPAPIPVSRVPWVMGNAGAEYDYDGTRYTAPDLRLVYWVGGNPMHHHQDRNKHIEYWQKPETIIVNEINWTQTARFADIVLPVCTNFEKNDMSMVSEQNVGIVAMKQAIEPLFESKSDFEIFAEISKRLGFEREFTEGRDEAGWLEHIYAEGLKDAEKKGVEMPDFETFWNETFYQEFPVTEAAKYEVTHASFREDPLLNPIATPSGMFEIYSRRIEGYNYDDCPPHPAWMEPIERLGGAMSDKYPLHVNTQHPTYRLHSQLDNNTALHDAYKVQGREPMYISPADAEARGIADGDIVRIFNDRGQCLAGAVISDTLSPNHIRLSEGGWYDPAEPGVIGTLCKQGDVNVLAPDIGTSSLAQGNCGHTILAEVEKYTGDVPSVTTYDPVV